MRQHIYLREAAFAFLMSGPRTSGMQLTPGGYYLQRNYDKHRNHQDEATTWFPKMGKVYKVLEPGIFQLGEDEISTCFLW